MKNDILDVLSKRTENCSGMEMGAFSEMFGIEVESRITTLPISKLREKENHPFKVIKDDKLSALAESIKENGLMEPIIVRSIENGFYEILAGHRRTAAKTINGDTDIRAIVIDVNDEIANRIMISTNFDHRENHLPSEIAKSYLIRYNDLKNSRKNQNENSNGWNLEKIDKIMEKEFCTSKSKVYMYLRLNHLIAKMLEAVDSKFVNLKIAIEISYLRDVEQNYIYDIVYADKQYKLDLKKAAEIKKESISHVLSKNDILRLLSVKEKSSPSSISFSKSEMKKYQSKFDSFEAMKKAILNFLENY